MQEALLLQKVEFFQIELRDARDREQHLKDLNRSLLDALDKTQADTLQVQTT